MRKILVIRWKTIILNTVKSRIPVDSFHFKSKLWIFNDWKLKMGLYSFETKLCNIMKRKNLDMFLKLEDYRLKKTNERFHIALIANLKSLEPNFFSM